MVINELLQHCFVTAARKIALVIEQIEKTVGFVLNQLQALGVVVKVNVAPTDSFPLVLFLLVLEHMLVEIVLQPLVCVVDAELFEIVVITEIFKSENI